MAWERLSDAAAWNRLGTTPYLSRGAFNYTMPKASPVTGAAGQFVPEMKGANAAQQAWAGGRSSDPQMLVADQMANYGWTGPNPYGMTSLGNLPGGSQWDAAVPMWARNAYEYGRATSMPSNVSNTAKYGNGSTPTTVPGFATPPEGWGGLGVTGDRFTFGREGNNSWLADSGIQLPSGDWDIGSIDYTKPNWWQPDSGAWQFAKEEKSNDLGGLGMMLNLGAALAGFGFTPPVLSMMGNSGGGLVPVQATMAQPSVQQAAQPAASPQVSAPSLLSPVASQPVAGKMGLLAPAPVYGKGYESGQTAGLLGVK